MIVEFYSQLKWLLIEQTAGIYFSDFLVILLVCALVILVPGYVLYIKKSIPYKRIVRVYFTLVFACIILLFTIFRREVGSRSGRIYTHLNLGVSRRAVYSRRQLIYCLFNVWLFVPWGMILSFYRKNESFLKIIIMTSLIGFLSSFCIEILQNLTRTGFFEVTDLIMNTLGTSVGAFLGFLLITYIKKRERRNEFK